MFRKLIKTYYKLLDEKLENGTLVVILIAVLIVWASLVTKDANALLYVKTNVLETNKKIVPSSNTVIIWWVQYRILLEEYRN